MDHVCSEVEGVNPQQYTATKMKVLVWSPTAEKIIESIVKDAEAYFRGLPLSAQRPCTAKPAA